MCEQLPADCEIVWDGTRAGPIGSRSANRDLLFWEPAYAEEEDPTAARAIVRKLSPPPVDVTEQQAEVLAAMGAAWTRPCTIVRRITLSHYAVNRALRMLVRAQQVEIKIMAASSFSRGVRWYRRVSES